MTLLAKPGVASSLPGPRLPARGRLVSMKNVQPTQQGVRRRRKGSADVASTDSTDRILSFARDAQIYREGDPTDHLYRIVEGAVRTCKLLLDGRRQIGSFYLRGDLFGFEPGAQHSFSSEAVTETKIILVQRNAVSLLQLQGLMRLELRHAQDQVLLLAKNAPERVASFLLEMAERSQSSEKTELPMSRRDMADYLGLTTETVSRMLTLLEKQSAIALPNSRQIVLRKPTVLRRLVNGRSDVLCI
jgi:CRP/FNR family nitrogen fixation transcriptional regulator